MPKGYGRASNPTVRKTRKTIERTEKTYAGMGRAEYGKAVTAEARRQLVEQGARDLAFRMRQADFERDTLVPSVRNAPSNFEVNAREERNRARKAAYEQAQRDAEKRRRAGPTNTISPGAPPRRKKK